MRELIEAGIDFKEVDLVVHERPEANGDLQPYTVKGYQYNLFGNGKDTIMYISPVTGNQCFTFAK